LATDRQTDKQMVNSDALSRSRYRERRLNNRRCDLSNGAISSDL